jgi:DNA-binding NtrC family response regulator
MQSNTVAIIDAHKDTVEMLACLLSSSGLQGIQGPAAAGNPSAVDFLGYMARHDPEAIIWNIAPPYERNWAFFKLLRRIGPLEDRAVVLTTTDKARVDNLVAQDPSPRIEVLGKPYGPELVVAAVKRAIDFQRAHSRPSWATSGTEGPRLHRRIADISGAPPHE